MPFTNLQGNEFVGRRRELEDLHRRALDTAQGRGRSLHLSGRRGAGKTELLKQLYTQLFWKQDAVVPFHYTVSGALTSATDLSRDYITRFILQWLAFEHKEQSLISLEGLSIGDLRKRAHERGASWAVDLLDRFRASLDEPIDALRLAVDAPRQSTLTGGRPPVILIDEFHRLENLARNGMPEPRLISLFEASLTSRKATVVISGYDAEIREMPLPGLLRIPLRPLTHDQSSDLFLTALKDRLVSVETVPPRLLDVLGGIPLYIHAVADAMDPVGDVSDDDFWRAYLREIEGGYIAGYWSSILKSAIRDPGRRRDALVALHGIFSEEISQMPETARQLRELPAEGILEALARTGLVNGEFGVFRPVEDAVFVDVVEWLYRREVLRSPAREVEKLFYTRQRSEKREIDEFELVLPMIREAELVAAQCLEQIGKSRHISEDIIGRLQMAVIEACINAAEHSKGGERKIYLTVRASGDRLEVSIESPGREFVPIETGEPISGKPIAEDPHRGWGVKLMKRFADDVRFERTGRGTRVVLVKNITRPSKISKKEDATHRE